MDGPSREQESVNNLDSPGPEAEDSNRHIDEDLDIPDLGDWQWKTDDPNSPMLDETSNNNIGESEFLDGTRAVYDPPYQLQVAIKSARTRRKMELASVFTNQPSFNSITSELTPEYDGGLFTYPLPVILVCRPTRGARRFHRLFAFPRDLGLDIGSKIMSWDMDEWGLHLGREIRARNWQSAFFALLRGLGLVVLCLFIFAISFGFLAFVVIISVPILLSGLFNIGLTTMLHFWLFGVVVRVMTLGMAAHIYSIMMCGLSSMEMGSPLIGATLASWMHWKVLVSFKPWLEIMC